MKDLQATIGVDLGGTNTKLGLLLGDTLLAAESYATRSYREPEAVLGDLLAAIARLQRRAAHENIAVRALGIGVPATIDMREGRTLVMPNFAEGWRNFKIVDYLRRATGLETVLINDARAFALAESTFGAGKAFRDVFGTVVGTGVGGGVVLDNVLRFGRSALAGEFGHTIVEPYGQTCGCGSVGCLETVASAPALIASVIRAYLHGRSPFLYALTRGDLNAINPETIAQAAREGEVSCLEAYRRVGSYLGLATAQVVTLLDPDCIVVGGGVAGASDLLFPVITSVWQRHLKVASGNLPSLRVAALQNPGVMGAALYAGQAQEARRL